MAMGAEYLFYMKSIETHARSFLALIILGIGTVLCFSLRIDMYFKNLNKVYGLYLAFLAFVFFFQRRKYAFFKSFLQLNN